VYASAVHSYQGTKLQRNQQCINKNQATVIWQEAAATFLHKWSAPLCPYICVCLAMPCPVFRRFNAARRLPVPCISMQYANSTPFFPFAGISTYRAPSSTSVLVHVRVHIAKAVVKS